MPGESRRARIRALLRRAGVTGLEPSDVQGAFVHSSAARERVPEAHSLAQDLPSNERLEFLGDTVIGFVVARYLYDKYPAADEGELALRKASLVSDVALASTASRLDLGALLIVGAGQAQKIGPGRTMLADTYEALVAAIMRGRGVEAAAAFVERSHIAPTEREEKPLGDPKTMLQEWTQKHHRSMPAYADRYEGPAHARTFHARVWVQGEWLAEGSGPSKKDAQRAAAIRALELLAPHDDAPQDRKTSTKKKSSRQHVAKTPHA